MEELLDTSRSLSTMEIGGMDDVLAEFLSAISDTMNASAASYRLHSHDS